MGYPNAAERRRLGCRCMLVAVGWVTLRIVLVGAIVSLVVPGSALGACGKGDRWSVKTMQDRPTVNVKPVDTTVDTLRAANSTGTEGTRAAGVESTKYRITADLILISQKKDGDLHLVIAEPGVPSHTMVVEFPKRKCVRGARKRVRKRIKAARDAVMKACPNPTREGVYVKGSATIVGMGFFDRPHAFGHSDNGVELHPVLRFSGTCERVSTRP